MVSISHCRCLFGRITVGNDDDYSCFEQMWIYARGGNINGTHSTRGSVGGMMLKIGQSAILLLSDLLISQSSLEKARRDVFMGRGSHSKGPIELHRLEDGRLIVRDGYHRLAEAIERGNRSIRVILISEGYTDYWATPMNDDIWYEANPQSSIERLVDIVEHFYAMYGNDVYRCVDVSKSLSDYLTRRGIKNEFVWAMVTPRKIFRHLTRTHAMSPAQGRYFAGSSYEHAWVEVGNYVLDITGPRQFGFDSPMMTKEQYGRIWKEVRIPFLQQFKPHFKKPCIQ